MVHGFKRFRMLVAVMKSSAKMCHINGIYINDRGEINAEKYVSTVLEIHPLLLFKNANKHE